MSDDQMAGLKKLREPFPASQIGKLPRAGMLLDFVGHAHLTNRLLDADLEWTWEPFAVDADGLPRLDEYGGLWIRLTVCGVTRPGYGDAGGKKGPNAIKEAVGDALRNSAMRFGAALDLWAKGDLDADHRPVSPLAAAKKELWTLLQNNGIAPVEAIERFASVHGGELKDTQDLAAVEEMIAHYEQVAHGA